MTKKIVPSEPVAALEVHEVPVAPFVFFDVVTTFGSEDGVVRLGLAAKRISPIGTTGVSVDYVVTGHLRCSIQAAINLRDAINSALLLGAPVEGQSN